jgi:hypothetical protein
MLGGWARTVVTGRARLCAIPVGVVMVETRQVRRVNMCLYVIFCVYMCFMCLYVYLFLLSAPFPSASLWWRHAR